MRWPVSKFSEEAVKAPRKECFLILRQIFRMKRLHTGHFIFPVQKFIFALTHLVKGQELHAGEPDVMQKICNSFRI